MLGESSIRCKLTSLLNIEGSKFDRSVTALFKALNEKITNPDATVVVVPYVQFYNSETGRYSDPNEADQTIDLAGNNCRTPKAHRQRFTDLTNELNHFLKVKADDAGFSFVGNGHLQPKFDNHRFCEKRENHDKAYINDSLWEEFVKKQCAPAANEDPSQACKDDAKKYDYKTGETLFHPDEKGHDGYKEAVKGFLLTFQSPNVD